MGCINSKDAAPAKKEKPTPSIFAIMRNGHEVIRSGFLECQDAINKGDLTSFIARFKEVEQWQGIHLLMEDGNGKVKGMWRFLEEYEPGCNASEIFGKGHHDVHDAEAKFNFALATGDLATIKTEFAKFAKINEDHLVLEEGTSMPLIMAFAQRGVPLKKHMCEDILPCATQSGHMDFFVDYAMRMTEKYPGDTPRCRVFAHALQVCATDEQWTSWHATIQKALSPAKYAAVAEEPGLVRKKKSFVPLSSFLLPYLNKRRKEEIKLVHTHSFNEMKSEGEKHFEKNYSFILLLLRCNNYAAKFDSILAVHSCMLPPPLLFYPSVLPFRECLKMRDFTLPSRRGNTLPEGGQKFPTPLEM